MRIALNKTRVILYLKIGLVYLIFWLFVDLLKNPETFFKRIVNNAWLISYLVAVNFILFEFTLPFIRLTVKRVLMAPVLIFANLMLYSFGLYAWRHIGIEMGIYFELRKHATILEGVEYHVGYSFLSAFTFGVIRYTYDLRMLKETAQKLRIEKQEAELNYLKSQTNPHFLFNTLNNIYSLALDKSDLAPESILRLSKILRFMLYEAGGDFISIEQELKIISDYIALEKLRYDDSLRINFNYSVEDPLQSVPPLLLIPLVENAFKHGVSETRSRPFVDIHLSVKDRILVFSVRNSNETVIADNKVRENIGLSNLRRQLQLLYRDYDLSVQHADSFFVANLTINLASHV